MSSDAAGWAVARLAKTDAGRTEIQRKSLPLSRPARNLLLIIDASRAAQDWIGLVQGATLADLQDLLRNGLLVVEAAALPTPPPRMSLAQALQARSQEVLLRRVLAEARQRLGRVRGYMLVVEAEYCVTADDVRALALKLVEQVRERDGDRVAIELAQVLIAPE